MTRTWPRGRHARSTSTTGGSPREPARADPTGLLAPPDEPRPGRPDDARRHHWGCVGRRPRRGGAGDDVRDHQPPGRTRDEPPDDQPAEWVVRTDPRRRERHRRGPEYR